MQRRLGMRLTRGVKATPAIEAACHACRHLGIESIQFDDAFGGEVIATTVGGMKAHMVAQAEAADQRVHLVGIAQVEGRMAAQALYLGQGLRQARGGLHRQPFVHHQRLMLPLCIERLQCLQPLGTVAIGQAAQGRHAIGHVVGLLELLHRQGDGVVTAGCAVQFHQIAQGQIAQRASPGRGGIGRVGTAAGMALQAVAPGGLQCQCQLPAQMAACGMQGIRIDLLHALGQGALRGQGQCLGGEGRIAVGRRQNLGAGGDESCGQRRQRLAGLQRLGAAQEDVRGQALTGLPAIEGIAVMRHQVRQFGLAHRLLQQHRCGEIAQDGQHRRLAYVVEFEHLLGFGQRQQAGALGQQFLARRTDQADRHRDVQGHARAAGQLLRQPQTIALCAGVIAAFGLQLRCAGVVVPAPELVEIDARGIGHGGNEILGGDGLAIMPLKIKIHALAKRRCTQQGVNHAHQLGPFFIHRGGVEIADLLIGLWPHRMRHRAGIFGELRCAQTAHFLDALHRTRIHVGAEFLIAKYRQAFLERELKPVATGDAIAGPVVKILMRHHAIDVLIIDIGSGVGPGQHVLGVEDIEALVLHRPHVEVAHRDDDVAIQVQLQSEHLLVPAHGFFQCLHGEAALIELARIDIDRQRHVAPRGGGVVVLQQVQLARNQGEQIAGLGKRIFPARPVPAIRQAALGHAVAIAQQHRKTLALRLQRDAITRHHIRAIEKPGDAPKAFGLALREQSGRFAVARGIQAHQLGVAGRMDAHRGAQFALRWQTFQTQHIVLDAPGLWRQWCAVDGNRQCLQLFALQAQRMAACGRVVIAAQLQGGMHQGVSGIEFETQFHFGDLPRRCAVVGQMNGAGRAGMQRVAHGVHGVPGKNSR